MESVQVFVRAAVARSANSLLAPPISMARSKILQPTLPDLLGKVFLFYVCMPGVLQWFSDVS